MYAEFFKVTLQTQETENVCLRGYLLKNKQNMAICKIYYFDMSCVHTYTRFVKACSCTTPDFLAVVACDVSKAFGRVWYSGFQKLKYGISG